jgi:hypothetical protein
MASSQPTGLAQSDDPWIIARDQYILDLNEEEKKLFTHATLENLLFESTNVQDTQEQKSSSRAFMQRLKPFLSVCNHTCQQQHLMLGILLLGWRFRCAFLLTCLNLGSRRLWFCVRCLLKHIFLGFGAYMGNLKSGASSSKEVQQDI